MVLTEVGHTSLSEVMFPKDFFLAWGDLPLGSEWDRTPPTEDINSTHLIEEVGRIKFLAKEYVIPDDAGIIDVDSIKWSISTSPSKYIYLKFQFEQTMNSESSIYQLGLFTDVVPVAGKETEDYLLPGDMDDEGKVVLIENQAVVYRNSATREVFEFVITF